MKEYITVGDVVNIYFENSTEEHEVSVEYVPVTGEENAWRLRRKDGTLVYARNFIIMELVKEAER